MQTTYYTTLKQRFFQLKCAFLPRNFSPTGNYRSTTYEKACAYKVLTHAEAEYYFEELTIDIAKRAFRLWEQQKKATPPLVAMTVYYSGVYNAIPSLKNGNNSNVDIYGRINTAFQEHMKRIKDKNNGIKECNILQLLLPIGITVDELDNSLLIALNNYGTSRGEIAHSTRSVTNILTPEDALQAANDLIQHISILDQRLYLLIQSM